MITKDISNIVLSKRALETIVKAAKGGYLKPYKEERLGILLGSLKKDTLFVSNAFLHRGGKYTRTSSMVLESQIDKHIKLMVSKCRLRFLGSFHTHNEVAKTTSSTLSKDDRNPISDTYPPLIEIIAAIRVSDGPLRQSKYYGQVKDGRYRIRIAAYVFGDSFPIVPVNMAQ
jgi:hypothetical protein